MGSAFFHFSGKARRRLHSAGGLKRPEPKRFQVRKSLGDLFLRNVPAEVLCQFDRFVAGEGVFTQAKHLIPHCGDEEAPLPNLCLIAFFGACL